MAEEFLLRFLVVLFAHFNIPHVFVCVCVCYSGTLDICLLSHQSPAEEHRTSAVMGCGPGDELLNVVQLATDLYCPLQLVLQTLLELLRNLLHK